ncbi:hypothetical protein [uncultured Tateyamaria sp.]|uniref:hypothetical protein n=1 Tax=uncultured Tateyamaria sp. TaxID=455651 RepID=UPI0026322074|nr:hypothetical protein [uncultured Tateyamaria sp.]
MRPHAACPPSQRSRTHWKRRIETLAPGGDGGKSFDIQAVQSIGFRSGSRIDALILTGVRYGGNGGTERKEITMAIERTSAT